MTDIARKMDPYADTVHAWLVEDLGEWKKRRHTAHGVWVRLTEELGADVPVRDSVEDYSWAELSTIADQIAAASSDDEGIEVAKRYHLCLEDGTLDETQLRSF